MGEKQKRNLAEMANKPKIKILFICSQWMLFFNQTISLAYTQGVKNECPHTHSRRRVYYFKLKQTITHKMWKRQFSTYLWHWWKCVASMTKISEIKKKWFLIWQFKIDKYEIIKSIYTSAAKLCRNDREIWPKII